MKVYIFNNTALNNTCECSNIGSSLPLYRNTGNKCINIYYCSNPDGFCTSLDKVTIDRRIQNQSRMPSKQFTDALSSITVANSVINFKGNKHNFYSMSSKVWGNKNYLRNQSDRTTPSRSGEWITSNIRFIEHGLKYNIPQYVNVPSHGNSTKTSLTRHRPGSMTPGGQGVDVKHGSYNRYLLKKKGMLFKNTTPNIKTDVTNIVKHLNNKNSGINNITYKFAPITIDNSCNSFLC